MSFSIAAMRLAFLTVADDDSIIPVNALYLDSRLLLICPSSDVDIEGEHFNRYGVKGNSVEFLIECNAIHSLIINDNNYNDNDDNDNDRYLT